MSGADITALIQGASAGDVASGDRLIELIYADLLRLARSRLARQRGQAGQLDANALVHEGWLRFAGRLPAGMASRRVFFAYAARAMESVLVDQMRRRCSLKRGAGAVEVTLRTGIEGVAQTYDESRFEALHAALQRLERIDTTLHELVRLRTFAGLSIEQVAELLQSSTATVKRRWRQAMTILREDMMRA
jgi:RNA polymerase sigma factor (TIGR02999 family)